MDGCDWTTGPALHDGCSLRGQTCTSWSGASAMTTVQFLTGFATARSGHQVVPWPRKCEFRWHPIVDLILWPTRIGKLSDFSLSQVSFRTPFKRE